MNRRAFIKVLIFISSILSFKIYPSQKKPNTSFNYGVASGDPTNEKIILWTKITTNSNKNIHAEFYVDDDFFINYEELIESFSSIKFLSYLNYSN